ncbi:response regulator [Candidatus Neomarinimicrobiota bacterium]
MTDEKVELNILIVDDLAMNLAYMRQLVELAGHKATQASDATRGLQLLRNDPTIDACLVDLKLPDLDGVQMYAAYNNLAREGHARQNIPFVLVTATQNVERFREAKSAGFVDVILKPPSAERIAEFLSNVQKIGHEDRDKEPLLLVQEIKISLDTTLKTIINTQNVAAAKHLVQVIDAAKNRLSKLLS